MWRLQKWLKHAGMKLDDEGGIDVYVATESVFEK